MPAHNNHWVSAQSAATILNSTSAEICRLLSVGRLTGIKQKQPGRTGKAQWLIDPESIQKELSYRREHAALLVRYHRRTEPRPAVPES
jgi:hypothetical protein